MLIFRFFSPQEDNGCVLCQLSFSTNILKCAIFFLRNILKKTVELIRVLLSIIAIEPTLLWAILYLKWKRWKNNILIYCSHWVSVTLNFSRFRNEVFWVLLICEALFYILNTQQRTYRNSFLTCVMISRGPSVMSCVCAKTGSAVQCSVTSIWLQGKMQYPAKGQKHV